MTYIVNKLDRFNLNYLSIFDNTVKNKQYGKYCRIRKLYSKFKKG